MKPNTRPLTQLAKQSSYPRLLFCNLERVAEHGFDEPTQNLLPNFYCETSLKSKGFGESPCLYRASGNIFGSLRKVRIHCGNDELQIKYNCCLLLLERPFFALGTELKRADVNGRDGYNHAYEKLCPGK